ncbi:TPA: hypothetical protein ACIYKD_005847, partial [Escherichia coli]
MDSRQGGALWRMKYDGDGRETARFFSDKGCRRRLRFTRPCGAWPCGFSTL